MRGAAAVALALWVCATALAPVSSEKAFWRGTRRCVTTMHATIPAAGRCAAAAAAAAAAA
eukprot:COSAG06_NODE_10762_length_1621_cov_2.371222_1_plen_59_part_10